MVVVGIHLMIYFFCQVVEICLVFSFSARVEMSLVNASFVVIWAVERANDLVISASLTCLLVEVVATLLMSCLRTILHLSQMHLVTFRLSSLEGLQIFVSFS